MLPQVWLWDPDFSCFHLFVSFQIQINHLTSHLSAGVDCVWCLFLEPSWEHFWLTLSKRKGKHHHWRKIHLKLLWLPSCLSAIVTLLILAVFLFTLFYFFYSQVKPFPQSYIINIDFVPRPFTSHQSTLWHPAKVCNMKLFASDDVVQHSVRYTFHRHDSDLRQELLTVDFPSYTRNVDYRICVYCFSSAHRKLYWQEMPFNSMKHG